MTYNDIRRFFNNKVISSNLRSYSFSGSGAGQSVPPPASYTYNNAVAFTSTAADGNGQKMNTSLALNQGQNYTFCMVVQAQVWTPCVYASQWGDVALTENSWILAPSDAATYGAGGDGFRMWFQNTGSIAAAQLDLSPLPANNSRVQIVVRYDGQAALEANRVRIWYASGSTSNLIEGGVSLFYPFGPSSVPQNLQSSSINTQIGGASYTTAAGLNGLFLDFAIWDRSLSPAEILSLRSSAAPTNPELITGITHHWRFGNNPSDAGTTIVDGIGGFNGTLTNEGNPATNPAIVAI